MNACMHKCMHAGVYVLCMHAGVYVGTDACVVGCVCGDFLVSMHFICKPHVDGRKLHYGQGAVSV